MSAELYSASEKNATLQSATLGGSKPLHRFIKGQPKIIGIIVLVLGTSFFIVSIAIMPSSIQHIWAVIQPSFIMGGLFIVCGILYIVTEHNPTKKTVTISLALSIVTILGICWTILHIFPSIIHAHHYRNYEYYEDNITETYETDLSSSETMGMVVEVIFVFYSFAGAVIFIVMSLLAGAALRSTNSQAIVMMTTTPTETAVE